MSPAQNYGIHREDIKKWFLEVVLWKPNLEIFLST
jgi:hypothetical protein